MTLYFLRHGEADWPGWDRPDDERPLTSAGKKEMRQVGRFLQKLEVTPDAILSSPLPRAWQTAEIVAEYLGIEPREEAALREGFNAAKLQGILRRNTAEELMIVGHEPGFSAVIRALTGGRIKLAKAGVARVELDDDGTSGRLIWLLPPRVAKT